MASQTWNANAFFLVFIEKLKIGGRGGFLGGLNFVNWSISSTFFSFWVILIGAGVRGASAWSQVTDFCVGVEYLPVYVLIVREHAGTIFTPQNNLSCKKFKETP